MEATFTLACTRLLGKRKCSSENHIHSRRKLHQFVIRLREVVGVRLTQCESRRKRKLSAGSVVRLNYDCQQNSCSRKQSFTNQNIDLGDTVTFLTMDSVWILPCGGHEGHSAMVGEREVVDELVRA